MTARLRSVAAALALAACTAPSSGPAEPSRTAALPTATATTPAPAGSPTPTVGLAFRDMPDEFYGVLRGRIAEFDAVTGKRTRWLTTPPRGFVDGSPAVVVNDRGILVAVAFARTRPDAPCGTARILRVALDGLRVTEVYRPVGVLTASAVSRDLGALVYTFSDCAGSGVRVRKVGLPSKKVFGAARSEFRGEGVVSVLDLSIAGSSYLTLGIHQRSWVTVLKMPTGQGEVNLDELPRLPMPEGCVASSGVVRVGLPKRSPLDWIPPSADVLTMTCPRADGYDVRLAKYDFYEDAPTVERIGTEPEFYELNGNWDNFLIGVRGEDDGTRYVRRVFQVAGTEERVLGACRSVDGTADACVTDPVW